MVDLVKARKKANEKKANEKKAAVSASSAAEEKQPKTPPAEAAIVAEPSAPKTAVDLPGEVVAGQATAVRDLPLTAEPDEKTSRSSGRILRRLDEIKASLGTKRLFSANLNAVQVAGPESQLELLLFSISGETYAVSIEKIVEIIGVRTATRVPNADDSIVGIISLRGTIVTILDLRRRLGHSVLAGVHDDTRIVVVEQEGETAGFVVDKVSRVVRIDPGIVGPPPSLADDQADLIHGVFQHGNNLAILLDLEKLLRS